MVILLFGPPGSGKGTQSRRVGEWLRMRAISTGEMLRAEVEDGTELGRGIEEILAHGQYVSDDIVNRLVEKHLDSQPESGIILDGYPRTLQQAEFLERAMAARGMPAPAVIRLEVPLTALVDRLGSRRQCPACGAIFHLVQQPPRVPGTCDSCRHALVHRSDDHPEIISQRLESYHELTEPVLAHFSAGNHSVDGTGAPDQVFGRIRLALEDRVSSLVRSTRR